MGKILLLDHSEPIHKRVYEISKELDHDLVYFNRFVDATNFLLKHKESVNLIITELTTENDEEFELIKGFILVAPKIPVIVLTTENKRGTLAKCIYEGASDYILKPFTDSFLLDRIQAHLKGNFIKFQEKVQASIKSRESEVEISEELHPFYLFTNTQLSRAKKSDTHFSMSLTLISKLGTNSTLTDKSLFDVSNEIFDSMNKFTHETDRITRYKNNLFLGAYVNMGKSDYSSMAMQYKNGFILDEIDIKYPKYEIVTVFVTYPEDGATLDELLKNLFTKIDMEK
jgi:DNA-binding response OmpR family regulator